jgi:outer membrane protein OmpA-like peptidoglycan-associated protein
VEELMKYLGWILLIIVLVAGIILYNTKYVALQNSFKGQSAEMEMWMSKTEQAKRQSDLNATRQEMAPDVSLLLADVFPSTDSFNLTKWAKDTLSAVTNELRRTKGEIVVSVYTDDNDASLFTKAKYYDAWALSAAKAAVVTRFLQSVGVPAERMVLQAYGIPHANQATLPDLQTLSTRRLEITVHAGQ